MATFSQKEIRELARLVWAMQILLKEVMTQLDIIGNSADLMKRIDRLERLVACSKGVLTGEEVCDYLGIGKTQMYNLVRNEGLKAFVPTGKMKFFKVEDVVDWIITHPNKRRIRPIEETGLIVGVKEDD